MGGSREAYVRSCLYRVRASGTDWKRPTMSRRAGGSSAGSTEEEEDAVEGVGEAADRAVRRWKEMGEERFRRWGRRRRRGLERTRSGAVAAAAVDAMDGGGGGFRFRSLVPFFREEKEK
jgi:hypothetical protein